MDIEKLKSMQEGIDLQAKKEMYEELPETLINFLKDDIVDFCLNKVKVRNHSEHSARVINNWIEQRILHVDVDDKGRVNRFTREEAIWLNLVTELRSFGVSLEKLKIIRDELFNEFFPSFTLFRFAIIRTILGNDQTLILFSDGNVKLISSSIYSKWIKRKFLPSHIHIDFIALLKGVFINNSFDVKFENNVFFENYKGVKVLFFLRTGDFDNMKIELQGYVRLIEQTNKINQEFINSIINEVDLKAEVTSNGQIFTI